MTFAEQLAAVEACIGRSLPDRLRELYRSGAAVRHGLLPLATGREHQSPEPGLTDVERFVDAQQRFNSVLGHALGNRAINGLEDSVWPPGLLLVEDVGCAIYRAVDLDDANLRVVECEELEPADDPVAAAGGARLAYADPPVPRNLQHRFVVVADSLEAWLEE